MLKSPEVPKIIDAVLLAGGRSRRMGSPKGLLNYDGKPWILHQVSELKKRGNRRILVVVGEHSEAYRSALAQSPEAIQIVFNPDFDAPKFTSLQLGLAGIAADCPDWIWIQPLDTVVPRAEIASILIEKCHKLDEKTLVIRPLYEGKRGHPVLMRGGFCQTLIELPFDDGSSRLDIQIRKLDKEQVMDVEVPDSSVLLDFNDPGHWRSFVQT